MVSYKLYQGVDMNNYEEKEKNMNMTFKIFYNDALNFVFS